MRVASKPTAPQNEVERRAYVVLSRVYLGIHHVPGWCRRQSEGGCSLRVIVNAGLSTYDYSELTRLVIAAHDECVRVEICPGGPRSLALWFSLRNRPGLRLLDDHSITDTHPTIEHAVKSNRTWRWQVDVSK